ncbi:MAG: GIY-YIG nuclease family protein [Candidatus Methylomirabilales bacterium]
MSATHYVYILKCADGKHYHGYTNDLKKRLAQHRAGESRATGYRLPVQLVYFEAFPNQTEAMRRERQFKRGRTRKETKERLIKNFPREKLLPFLE